MQKKETKQKKKRSSKTPVAVTIEEYVEILKQTTGLHHRMGMMLAFESGLRISEVTHLRPEHINLKEKTIQVRGGKGNKDRVTILPESWDDKVHRPLLPMPCTKRALQKEFELACKRTGLKEKKKDVHFHSLRHGFATFCYEQGVPLEHIQILLGHSDISTTMVYVRVSPFKAIKSARQAFEIDEDDKKLMEVKNEFM